MLVEKNNITSEYKNLYSYQNQKIGIPIFQRFYAWKTQQITQLKNDLLEISDDTNKQLYFLDFIYYYEDGVMKIADGQQRLVTLNNLIKVINDVIDEKQLNVEKLNLFDISYDIKENDKKYQTHFYNYVTSPFKTIYLDLKEFVYKHIELLETFSYIIKNNIYAHMKKCLNADDAFVIFQQINTGGKPLTKDEVIKTAIDQYSKIYGVKVNLYKIKEMRQSLISFYKLKKNDLDKNFDNMQIITFLKEFVTKDKETFKNFIETIDLLNSLQNNPIRYVINYINRATLLDVLNILAMKKIDTSINKKYLTKVLIPLCMMSIVLSLKGGSPTTFRYLLNDVIKMIKNQETAEKIEYFLIEKINKEPDTWKIDIVDFNRLLGDKDTSRGIKKALLVIDIIDKNISGTINVPSINLEHIYPQNPSVTWAINGWPTNAEEQRQIIDNIGNYLLLCEEVNKKIQNQYVSEKVEKYKQIILKDKILQTQMNTIDFGRFEKEGEKYIKERQNQIAHMIYNTLPFGKVLILKH